MIFFWNPLEGRTEGVVRVHDGSSIARSCHQTFSIKNVQHGSLVVSIVSTFAAHSPSFKHGRISAFDKLLSHTRFMMTIRSQEGSYHGLILFRLTTSGSDEDKYKQIYIRESSCPHLGADMSHADIEEYEDSFVAVCPWHRKVRPLRALNRSV